MSEITAIASAGAAQVALLRTQLDGDTEQMAQLLQTIPPAQPVLPPSTPGRLYL